MSKNLQNDQEPIEGSWWEPSNPKATWQGVLIMEAGKSAILKALELGTSFLKSNLSRLPYSRKLIHGITKDGTSVTLWKCITCRRSQSFGSQETHFTVQHVIFGEHFLEEKLLFDEVHVIYDYLNDWVTYSRFKTKNRTTDKDSPKQINMVFNEEYQFPFQAPGYAEAEFYIGYQTHDAAFEYSIRSLASLQITFPAPKPLEDIFKDLTQWSWFLTLATGHQTHLSSMLLHRDDLRFDLGDVNFKEPHDVWTNSLGIRKNKKPLRDTDMIFSLPDIQKDLSSVITRWKNIQIPWAAVLHRYFASIHRHGIQLQEQFLFRAQAIEALHRARTCAPKVHQKEAYASAWMNAPQSLQTKLGDKNTFIEAVRVNRNYLTHYSLEDEKKAAETAELFDLTQKLGFILQAAILNVIGISSTCIEEALEESRWGQLIEFDTTD